MAQPIASGKRRVCRNGENFRKRRVYRKAGNWRKRRVCRKAWNWENGEFVETREIEKTASCRNTGKWRNLRVCSNAADATQPLETLQWLDQRWPLETLEYVDQRKSLETQQPVVRRQMREDCRRWHAMVFIGTHAHESVGKGRVPRHRKQDTKDRDQHKEPVFQRLAFHQYNPDTTVLPTTVKHSVPEPLDHYSCRSIKPESTLEFITWTIIVNTFRRSHGANGS